MMANDPNDIYEENTISEDIESKHLTARVTALVVTYNRKELLKECLDAILSQSYAVDNIIVIDNASTDGTLQMLKKEGYGSNPKVSYHRMKKNLGGSGGFYEGLKCAMKESCDFIWMMDDDTIPAGDCLEKLLDAYELIKKEEPEQPVSFLASTVYDAEGALVNPPAISMREAENGFEYWYKYLDKGIVSIKSASFVSILVNRKAVLRCGYPCKDFFIWGDDTEYTRRLSTYYGDAYFMGDSKAIHKKANARRLTVENETDPEKIKLYRYFYRNTLIYRHYYNDAYLGGLLEMARGFVMAARHLKFKPYGLRYAMTILRGTWDGIWQYNKFKRYIDAQLQKSDEGNIGQ